MYLRMRDAANEEVVAKCARCNQISVCVCVCVVWLGGSVTAPLSVAACVRALLW